MKYLWAVQVMNRQRQTPGSFNHLWIIANTGESAVKKAIRFAIREYGKEYRYLHSVVPHGSVDVL